MWRAHDAAWAGPDTEGRWLGPYQTPARGTHSVLLRRRTAQGDSSLVLFWHYSFDVRAWPYTPNSSGDTLATALGVGSSFNVRPDTSSIDIFCAGHATLDDGKLFIASGTAKRENGDNKAKVFDPGTSNLWTTPPPTSGNPAWSTRDTLRYERWYPTTTTLADGTVLASAGLQYFEALVFGGRTPDDTSHRRVQPMALTSHPYMAGEATTVPFPQLTDHASVFTGQIQKSSYDLRGAVLSFGGVNDAGALQNTLWATWHYATDPRNIWRSDSGLVAAASAHPAPRSETAIASRESGGGLGSYELDLWVFWGRDAEGNAIHDIWRYNDGNSGDGTPGSWSASTPAVAVGLSGPPRARFGHTAIFDPGPATPDDPRIYIYGGKWDANTWASDTVWMLKLVPTPTWYVATTGGPGQRYRHAAAFDGVVRDGAPNKNARMAVFGGLGTNGLLKDDTWILERTENGAIQPWREFTTPYRLSPRYKHAMVYDFAWDRLLVFGGYTTTTGAKARTTWVKSFYPVLEDSSRWVPLAVNDALPPTSGHALVMYGQSVNARVPERFTPWAAAGSQWSQLSSAPKFDRDLYPFIFQLPSGNLLYAGKLAHSSRLLLSGTPAWTDTAYSGLLTSAGGYLRGGGTSAVMYEPGKVMLKGIGYSGSSPQITTRIAFDANDATSGWTEVMSDSGKGLARTNHNLTVLPDGKVLATGGASELNAQHLAQKREQHAEIWDPSTALWSLTALASEPAKRGYHSTGLLLPDARVLCLGGDQNDDIFKGTIYEPPYLFANGGGYATRPRILSYPDTMIYGPHCYTVTFYQAASISRVCLIRPGAATHAFNQNQRYAPLDFTQGAGVLTVRPPSNGYLAPPGDYLLFVCDGTSRKTPSVAKWVTVAPRHDPTDTNRPTHVSDLAGGGGPCHEYPYEVSWHATRDDSAVPGSGRVTLFDLRRRTDTWPDSDWSKFATATQIDCEPVPGAEGALHSVTLSLPPGSHVFRLVSKDDMGPSGNYSAMSNLLSIHVPDCHDPFYDDGGGGGFMRAGGFAASRAGGAGPGITALAGAPSTSSPLFGTVPEGEVTTDVVALSEPLRDDQGRPMARIRREAEGETGIHDVHLIAVDHEGGEEVFRFADRFVAGTRQPALGLRYADGSDASDLIAGDPSHCLVGDAGDVVTLALAGSGPLYLHARGAGRRADGAPAELSIQTREAGGAWVGRARITPAKGFADCVVDSVPGDSVRLVFHGNCAVTAAGRIALSGVEPIVHRLDATGAWLDATGTLDLAVFSSTGPGVTLRGGDTLLVTYSEPALTSGTRHWFLEATGWTRGGHGTYAGRLTPGDPADGGRFAFSLAPNEPNPFTGGTRFRFTLAQRLAVRFEIYDVAGRRVRRLLAATLDPGRHALEWDGRDDAGRKLRSGVYLCRLVAGRDRAERKLVLYP